MPLVREAFPWFIIVLLLSILLWRQLVVKQASSPKPENKNKRPWSLRPKTPKDCPGCTAQVRLRQVNPTPAEPPPPWEMVKGPGGRKKTVDTEGQACDNPDCRYINVRDPNIHALAGNGVRGKTDAIQRLICLACGNRFNVRRDTALKDLKTDPERIELAMNLAAEGVGISVIARVLGHCEETIARWLERSGRQAGLLHDHYFHDLSLPYVQVDELQTKVRRWSHLKPGDKAWLWAAIDPRTKVIPVLHLGGRTTADAMLFIHELVARLARGCVPLFTSDGLRQYYWAITAHFGSWLLLPGKRVAAWVVDKRLKYGQLKKQRRGRKLSVQTQVLCGSGQELRVALEEMAFSGLINTSFIERFNLTFRQMVAALSRKTWSLAQSHHKLLLHLEWSRAYYHFVRCHQSLSLDRALPRQQRERTPAMAAGLTGHRWRTLDILKMPLVAAGGG